MKRLFLIFLFLLISCPAWGATYYLKQISGTWKYLENAWPTAGAGTTVGNNTIRDACAALDDAVNTIIIYPGTYPTSAVSRVGYNYQLASAGTGITLRAPQAGDADYPSVSGAVTLDGTSCADTFIAITHTGWSVSGITIQNATGSGKYGLLSTTDINTNDITIKNCNRGLYLGGGGTHNRLKIENITGLYALMLNGISKTNIFNYPIFTNNTGTIHIGQTCNLTFNNPIFTGFYNRVIEQASGQTSTVVINNPIFSGNGLDGTSQDVIKCNSGGTWTLNGICADAPIGKGSFFSLTTGATINNTCIADTQRPRFISNKFTGNTRVHLNVDDAGNYAAFYSLADLSALHGYTAGFALSMYGADSIDFQKIARYINQGHEIMCHGRSWSYAGNTNAFTAKKVGSSIVIAITRADANNSTTWTGTLQLDSETPIDLKNASYDTVPEVIAYLKSKGVTIGTGANQTTFDGVTPTAYYPASVVLASGTFNINDTTTLLFDETSQLVSEILEPKTWLESQIRAVTTDDLGTAVDMSSWTAKTYVWGGGVNSANSIAYALGTAGFEQARAAGTWGNHRIKSINQGKIGSVLLATYFGTTASDSVASITSEIEGYIDNLIEQGGVGGIFAHDYVAADWAIVMDVLDSYKGSIAVENISATMDWVRANDDHVTDYVSYRCSTSTDSCMTDNSNYHLQYDSPAINEGVAISGLTTDYEGNALCTLPDLGAYERQCYFPFSR